MVLVGMLCRARAARVDHNNLAAPLADPADPPAHVGRRQKAAVRDQRIRAPDHQVIAVIDVRDRNRRPVAEHVPGREVLRHLVDRRGGIDVLRAESPEQDLEIDHGREVVGVRVPGIDSDGVAPALFEDGPKAGLDGGERLLPGRLAKLSVAPDKRSAQPVGVLAKLLQAERLRADEAGREHVFFVASDRVDLAVI